MARTPLAGVAGPLTTATSAAGRGVERVGTRLLAAVIYIPLMLTHRGEVGADTKSYLYIDPDRLLSRAWSMWDPNVGLGTVPHQNIGYLWPMGPFYWTFEHLGVPDWFAQRLWLGSIMFGAGLGVRYLMRTLGHHGPGVVVAMWVYALTPYVLTLAARISALLLPYTALAWLLAFTIRALRERGWLYPALFALFVTTFGSTNATALFLVGIAPALWVPYAVIQLREARWRDAFAVTGQIGSATVAASLWWISGLWCQGSFGIDVLRYTETARTVAQASVAPEVLRGLGYWFFYGQDKLGPWIEPSTTYTELPNVIMLTYALPVLGLVALGLTRWRYRGYFLMLVVAGAVISIGAYPWDSHTVAGQGFQAFLNTSAGLAMRSLPRAAPLLVLGFAVALGAAVEAGAVWGARLQRRAAVGVCAIALVCLPPLWMGQMVSENLQRTEQLPGYWEAAAASIDSRGSADGVWQSRVFEVPGTDFAAYRWGNTVDPITPGLIDRPYVARELIPYGTPVSADLLNALDRAMQEEILDAEALAPMARLMGVGELAQRSDLAYERFNTVRPRQLYSLLGSAPDLVEIEGFGGNGENVPGADLPLVDELELSDASALPNPPKVGLFRVERSQPIVVARPESQTVLVAGSGEGLIAAASAGLIEGDELIRYSGTSMAAAGGGRAELLKVGEHSVLLVTDSNRKASRRWGSVRETNGMTEMADSKTFVPDPTDNRLPLFEGSGTDSQTVAIQRGGLRVEASSYGNSVTYTPEDRAANALDDDPLSAWYAGAFESGIGEFLQVRYDKERSTHRVHLVQASRGEQNRWITKVRFTFDGGPSVERNLDETSRVGAGQWVDVGARRFKEMKIEVVETDVPTRDSYSNVSAVGLADVALGDGDLRVHESIRPPVDLLAALGSASQDRPLALVFNRARSRPEAVLRLDEESRISRDVILPTPRDFGLSGTARLADTAPDSTIDSLIGLPSLADGGIEVETTRHLAGDLRSRGSAAIDGDPTTYWMPGFLSQDHDWARYSSAEAVSFDHLDLEVVADGRHSVPISLRVTVDGKEFEVQVPEVFDQPFPNAVQKVRVALPEAVTGKVITIGFGTIREATTTDWLSGEPIIMPVGIAEWGISGLSVPAAPARFDTGCVSDVLRVGDTPVAVRITGSTTDALEGEAMAIELCGRSTTGVHVPAGTTILETSRGRVDGVSIDRISLTSAAGGAAQPPGVLVSGLDTVSANPVEQGRWHSTVRVGARTEGTWLVIGQSNNLGWKASTSSGSLGAAVEMNGYSSAFWLPAGPPTLVSVVWYPQKVVLGTFGISLVSVVLCGIAIGVATWRRRRRVRSPEGRPSAIAAGRDPHMTPTFIDWRHSPGKRPRAPVIAAVTLLSGAMGYSAIGSGGLLLGVIASAVVVWSKARPLASIGPAAGIGACALFIAVQQARHSYGSGFIWPALFDRVHGLGYASVMLLALSPALTWVRTRSDARKPDPK